MSRTRLSDFTFTFHFHALEKEMATHSSVLAWRIPGMGEPGGLPSVWSHRVGHDWGDLAAAAAAAVMFTMCLWNCRIGSSQNDDSIKRAGPIIILCKVCMIFHQVSRIQGFPGGSVVKTACQLRRLKFDLWVERIPRRRKGLSTPIFLPWKSHGRKSLAGYSP